jgi:hypothetical protein
MRFLSEARHLDVPLSRCHAAELVDALAGTAQEIPA